MSNKLICFDKPFCLNHTFENLNEHENIHIFVGKNAGKKLENDINNAEKTITIVSPYIDIDKINKLIKLSQRGIKVKILLSESKPIKDNAYVKDILKEVIREKITKEYEETYNKAEAKEKNRRNKILFRIINFFKREPFPKYFKELDNIKKYKYYFVNDNIEIYYFLKNNCKNEHSFIHAKLYIIDTKIVHMGSLNFTNCGFVKNLETNIQIECKDYANKLNEYVCSWFETGTQINYLNMNNEFKNEKSLGSIIYNRV